MVFYGWDPRSGKSHRDSHHIEEIVVSIKAPDLSLLCFRHPNHFVAGGVHNENLFWSSMDGIPVHKRVTEIPTIEEIIVSRKAPDLSLLRFRDPKHFMAGGVHKDPSAWQKILISRPKRDQIFTWILNKVDVHDFVRHFSGTFKCRHTTLIFLRLSVSGIMHRVRRFLLSFRILFSSV